MSRPTGPRSSTRERLAESLLEPRVVAYGVEVAVASCLLAERWECLDALPEVGERVVVDLAGERREARVVVVEARVIRVLLEGTAHRGGRVRVALLAVGLHRLAVVLPRLAPVHRLVRLADRPAEGEHRGVA